MFSRMIGRRISICGFNILKTVNVIPIKCSFNTIATDRLLFVRSSIISQKSWCSHQTPTENATVDYDYVKKALSNNDVLIVDVREPDEVKEHGKIPNSVNIPLGTVTSTLGEVSDKEFQEKFNRPKPKKDTEILFYCMIGKRSGKAQKNALDLGYKNAKNYLGSWTDWAAKTN